MSEASRAGIGHTTKGMAHELVPSGKQPKEVLTRAIKVSAIVVANPTVGEP